MIKSKSQKGITLIALIITIIVLLILAVVAIGAVQNDGIIKHAKNAREEYGQAQINENTTLEINLLEYKPLSLYCYKEYLYLLPYSAVKSRQRVLVGY